MNDSSSVEKGYVPSSVEKGYVPSLTTVDYPIPCTAVGKGRRSKSKIVPRKTCITDLNFLTTTTGQSPDHSSIKSYPSGRSSRGWYNTPSLGRLIRGSLDGPFERRGYEYLIVPHPLTVVRESHRHDSEPWTFRETEGRRVMDHFLCLFACLFIPSDVVEAPRGPETSVSPQS